MSSQADTIRKGIRSEMNKKEQDELLLNISGSTDIEFIIRKLTDLEKAQGGKRKEQMRAQKGGNELDYLKGELSDMVEEIKGKVQQWNTFKGKKDAQSISKRYTQQRDVQTGIKEANSKIKSFELMLNRQAKDKKINDAQNNKWKGILNIYKSILGDFQDEIDGKDNVKEKGSKTDNYVFTGAKKTKADDDGEDDYNIYNKDDYGSEDEKDGDIIAKRAEWKQKQVKIDDMLEGVNGILDEINDLAIEQNQAIRDVDKLGQDANKEMNTNLKSAKSVNRDLSDVLQKYRGNSAFCRDMCMIIFQIGLIGMIVNMLR